MRVQGLLQSSLSSSLMSAKHFQGYTLFKLFIHIPAEATLLKYSPRDGLEPSCSTEAQSVTISAVQSVSFAGELIINNQ